MNPTIYEWSVIGAGPAGIAAVGQLIDHGVDPNQIVWFDPHFRTGDFGSVWNNVPSNTQVKLFLKFFQACKSFQYETAKFDFDINHLEPNDTCLLKYAAEPLRWISDQLQQKVKTFQTQVETLKLTNQLWHLYYNDTVLLAKNVILAIGAEPKKSPISHINPIDLKIALDPEKLKPACDENDTIAVFGSSHSAILILKSLLEETNVKKIINFYLSPLKYAVYFDDWILFDNTGLKGTTAVWARENIDGKLPNKLIRVLSNADTIKTFLPQCSKAIYAAGFERRTIAIDGIENITYNEKTGIIAPGLFGLGIAFPEAKTDRLGNLEYRVGLWKFMEYLQNIMPLWLRYGT